MPDKSRFVKKPTIDIVTRKPILAGADELEENPRARSAKLRVAEKCSLPDKPPFGEEISQEQ